MYQRHPANERPSRQKSRLQNRRRLLVESLEDRRVLATMIDLSPASLGLNVASNQYAGDHAVGLAGLNENPQITTTASGNETGAGIAYDESTNLLSFQFGYGTDGGFGDLQGDFAAAHIHGSGPVQFPAVNANASVLFNLAAFHSVGSTPSTGEFVGSLTLSDAQEELLYENALYVNIHTSVAASGEIRAQLIPVATTDEVHVSLSNGVLRVSDIGAESDESLSFTVDGDNLVITDGNNTISGSGSGVSGSGTQSIIVPLANITGGINVNTGAGNDDVDVTGVTLSGMSSSGLTVAGVETLAITGSIFTDNTAVRGGGLHVTGGLVAISDSTFTGNTATGSLPTDGGGGIYNDGASITITAGTVISGNIASGTRGSGGGILSVDGDVSIVDSELDGNSANRAGGAIEIIAGTLSINNSDLTNNDADGGAGLALPGNGGAIHTSGTAAVSITGGIIQGNRAASEGGGVWNSGVGSLSIDGTVITDNSAAEGGGIYNDTIAATADQVFALTFTALNGSGVTGTGSVTLSSPTATTRSVRVVIDTEGLQDLSGIPGAIHVAHIHGQFAGNADRPLLQQGGGAFFAGTGGTPADSVLPSLASDDGKTVADGFLDFLEGRPKYGPVILNLTSTQMRDALPSGSNPPDGVGPLGHFLALAGAGQILPGELFPNGSEFNLDTTYTFDLTNADEARQFNNLSPLSLREVVLHGQAIDKSISDAIDAAAMGTAPGGIDLGNGMAFRVTAPVAAAEIVAVSGSITITGATITNNVATGNGGGLLNEGGAVSITDSVISNNVSGSDSIGSGGGGIFNTGALSLSGGTVSNNTATVGLGNGGGIFNAAGATLTVSGTAITQNEAARAGGGIENAGTVDLTDATLSNNAAGINGGGLHTSGFGIVAVHGGTVSGNVADSEGGGLWNSSGGSLAVYGTGILNNEAAGNDSDQGGGGIFNDGGLLTITDVVISGNIASGSSGSGGGVLNNVGGTLIVSSSTISGNTSNRAGGGIEDNAGASVLLNDVDLLRNSTGNSPGNGGGLHITGAGNVTINDSTVLRNVAGAEGGGLWNSSTGTLVINGGIIANNIARGTDTEQGGGGIFNDGGTVTIDDALITGNEALGDSPGEGGGGIFNDGNLTITDTRISSNSAIVGLGNGGGILNSDGGVLVIHGGSISDNEAIRAGGGIENNAGSLTITGTDLNGNRAGINGGAIHVTGPATTTLLGGSVTGNVATNEGGGVWNSSSALAILSLTDVDVSGNRANFGGGLFNDGNAGTINITSSTIAENRGSVSGGGLLSEGGNVNLTTSTISSNTTSGSGGGIQIAAGNVDLQSATIALNRAGTGGGLSVATGSVTSSNTIFAGNLATTGPDISGTVVSNGFNLISNTLGATLNVSNDITNADARLGGLIDNGGATRTHALLSGSAAINAGTAIGLTTDQRGISRPQGTGIDIGAFESDLDVVIALPDFPLAVSDQFTVAQGSVGTAFDLLSNDMLSPNNPALITQINGQLVTAAGQQFATINGGTVSISGTSVSYTPATGFSGNDSFTYTIATNPDSGNGPSSSSVSIAVTPNNTNDTPNAQDDQFTIPFGSGVQRLNVLANDSAGLVPTGDSLRISSFTQPSSGTVSIDNNGTPNDPSDDRIRYQRSSRFVGTTDSFTYTVTDNGGLSDSATVTLVLADRGGVRYMTGAKVTGAYAVSASPLRTLVPISVVTDAVIQITPVATASATNRERILNADQIVISENNILPVSLQAGTDYFIDFPASNDGRGYEIKIISGSITPRLFTNFQLFVDVNADGEATPLDALVVLNNISRQAAAEGETFIANQLNFLDVNQDNLATPIDALIVLNHLQKRSAVASGEATPPITQQSTTDEPRDLFEGNRELDLQSTPRIANYAKDVDAAFADWSTSAASDEDQLKTKDESLEQTVETFAHVAST